MIVDQIGGDSKAGAKTAVASRVSGQAGDADGPGSESDVSLIPSGDPSEQDTAAETIATQAAIGEGLPDATTPTSGEANREPSTALEFFGIPWSYAVAGLFFLGTMFLFLSRFLGSRKSDAHSFEFRDSGLEEPSLLTTELPSGASRSEPLLPMRAEESSDSVLQSISEFDETILSAEQILSRGHIDRETRVEILDAVEVARSMIEQSLSDDSGRSGNHDQTGETIERATKLIRDAIDSELAETRGFSAHRSTGTNDA